MSRGLVWLGGAQWCNGLMFGVMGQTEVKISLLRLLYRPTPQLSTLLRGQVLLTNCV